jgi:FG-GAP-like repeat/Abnormal spindle-like microcephaly-assoc'd, ASPM-SPD-2-Hydin/FG-GAP repeat
MKLRNLIGWLILIVLFSAYSAFGQCIVLPVCFAAPTNYNVGGPSTVIAAADFNGDGYPDLAVEANYVSPYVSDSLVVLMNNGDGTFGVPIAYSLPNSQILAILPADVNGDGHLDLVVGTIGGPSGFWVFINNGDRTFQPPVFYADANQGSQVFQNSWAVGDFFTNGRVAVAIHRVGLFGVPAGTNLFSNDGNGNFAFSASFSDDGHWLSTADVNGDGIIDFVDEEEPADGNSWYVGVTLGTGNGNFPTNSPLYLTTGPIQAIADVSSPTTGKPDGFPDILTTNGDPQIALLVNNADGTGTFAPFVNYNVPSWPPSVGPTAAADFNGDGIPDLATLSTDPHEQFWYAEVVTSGNGFTYAGPSLIEPWGCTPPSFLGIDLDGDGLPDLVSTDCGSTASSIHVLLSKSTAVGDSAPVQFSPPSLTFPPLTITKTSIVRTVTLNYLSGTGLLNISNVSISGDFALVKNNCPAKLAAGGSCTFSLTFTPTATGSRTGALTITDNQIGSPHVLSLTGTGKDPAVTFSQSSLTFAGQVIGTTSVSKSVKLKNTGIGDLVIGSLSASGDFAETDTCAGMTVHAGGNCTVTLTFSPSIIGAITGAITVIDDGRKSPQILKLSGTGLLFLTFKPASIEFRSVSVGSTSAPQTVTVTNNWPSTLGLTYLASGDFSASPGGPSPCSNNSVSGGSSCTLSVVFTPSQTGVVSGGLLVYSVSQQPPLGPVISLSGSGTGGSTAPLIFSPVSTAFPPQVILTSVSSPKTVTVKNRSAGAVNITSLYSDFSFGAGGSGSTPCGGTPLLPGKSCTFDITFSTSELGTQKGSIAIYTNNAVSPQIYPVSGIGILPITFAPTSLNFAPQSVGTTSSMQTVTITNNQNKTLNIASIVASGQYAAMPGGTTPCGTTLAPQGQCTVTVTFSPTITGVVSGVVTVTHDAPSSPQEIKLTGTGQ